MQEAGYLKRLSHPNIVKYLDDFYLNGEFHLVVEYISGENMMPSSPRASQGEQKSWIGPASFWMRWPIYTAQA